MNQNIQQKIDQYKKTAQRNLSNGSRSVPPKSVRVDSLAQVIRSQKDAENFMAELNSIVKRAQ